MNFLKGFFTENDGTPSSKRLVGVIGAFGLIAAMFIHPCDTLYYCVTTVTLGGLAITGFEKILSK